MSQMTEGEKCGGETCQRKDEKDMIVFPTIRLWRLIF